MHNSYRDLLKNKKLDDNLQVCECCENPSIEERDGNKVCLNCGMILARTYVGTGSRAYGAEEVQTRRRT